MPESGIPFFLRLAVLFLFAATPVRAQIVAGAIDAKAVEEIIEPYISTKPGEGPSAPGAHVAVIDRDGEKILLGFGVAGAPENGREPMDPRRHLFRIASQTKVFTAVAVMQLCERGLINLDDDVNKYLKDFKLEEPYHEPVTIRNLLQHTSGIDDDWMGMARRTQQEHRRLSDVLKEHKPKFRRPPGVISSYTNRSYMLLGHLIEAVTGVEYEVYMQEHVFNPLDMRNTTFVLDERLASMLAWGTNTVDGAYKEIWIADTLTRPSGDIMTTAEDMSHFLAMLLDEGIYGGERLLQPETVEAIFGECKTIGPGLPGRCLGPSIEPANGVYVWAHGGGHPGYHSRFIIDRARGYALYMGFLNYSVSPPKVYAEFLDRFFPAKKPSFAPTPITRASEIEGDYQGLWSSFRTVERSLHLINGDTRFKIEGDYLVVGKDRYIQTAPLVFRGVGGDGYSDYLVFHENAAGKIDYALTGSGGYWKLPWHQRALIGRIAGSISIALLIIYIIASAFKARDFAQSSAAEKIASCLTVALSALWIIVIAASLYSISSAGSDLPFGAPAMLRSALIAVKAAAAATAGATLLWILVWYRARSVADVSLMHGVALASMLMLIVLSANWRLLQA